MEQMEKTVTRKYYEEINIMKGFAAVLVVLGHAIMQTGVENTAFQLIYQVLYSFHMPLFFFASGFLSIKILDFRNGKERLEYVKSRFVRLLVPYFSMGILYLPARWLMGSFANESYDLAESWRIFLGENPDGALWFLYALFLISIFAGVIIRRKNLPWVLAFSVLLALMSKCMVWPTIICEETLFHLFFFVLGLYVREHYEKLQNVLCKNAAVLIAVILFVGANWMMWNSYAIPYLDIRCLKLVTAPAGILLSLNLAQLLIKSCKESNKLRRLGNLLGDYCMDIYIFAEPIKVMTKILFWSLLHWNYLLCTVLCFVLPIILAIFISKWIVRRVPVLQKLFLGKA